MIFTRIPCDMHMHTSFSEDSETPMEEMIQRAIGLGLKYIAFTEHMDYDYHPEDGTFLVDLEEYQKTFLALKAKYSDQIELLFGLELGMQPHLADRLQALANALPFDYLLASQHLVFGRDPYYRTFWENRTTFEVLTEYFTLLYEDLRSIDCWDTCAHLDYLIRYLPDGPSSFDPASYMDQIEPILKLVIEKNKTLEINTSPYAKGYDAPNPSRVVLERYYALGGRNITLGSDAHVPAGIGCMFEETANMLREIGFTEITCYRGRQAFFLPL